MAYRYDPDLEFLSKCTDEDLNDLVYCLTYDKDGSKRLTEELTLSDAYKKHHPYHSLYWEEIAAEIQCFGGNTFANIFRGGKGVLYKEVLCDVCDKMKVNYNKNSTADRIEDALLSKILEDSLEKMSPDEIRQLAAELGIQNTQNITKCSFKSINWKRTIFCWKCCSNKSFCCIKWTYWMGNYWIMDCI